MRDGRKPVTGAPIGLLIINPYSPNVTFLCPLETSENLGFSGVFGGVQICNIRRIWVKQTFLLEKLQSSSINAKFQKFHCDPHLTEGSTFHTRRKNRNNLRALHCPFHYSVF